MTLPLYEKILIAPVVGVLWITLAVLSLLLAVLYTDTGIEEE